MLDLTDRPVVATAPVLHLPIVIAISFVVVDLPLGLAPKALINVGLGVGITVLVATAALRLPVLRALLGARRRRPTAPPAMPVPHPSSQTAES